MLGATVGAIDSRREHACAREQPTAFGLDIFTCPRTFARSARLRRKSRSQCDAIERVQSIQRFGYTERESQFLELAALHSGYLVRRQFNMFIGRARVGAPPRS